jgi:RimJ/RimL family protein N-acetyltransferase
MLSDEDAAWRFAPLEMRDLPVLREWMGRAHVSEWWRPTPSVAELRAEYLIGSRGADRVRAFIAHRGSQAVGFIQCYVAMGSGDGWWAEVTDPGVRGIDQFLADPSCLGKGIGSAMISAFADFLFEDPRVTAIQADPSPSNQRAIRSYAKAGFRGVTVMKTPDGEAFLMRRER